jgi:hypothetical protein
MTLYYFHTFDDETPSHLDDVGEELPTREAAWEMATRYAAECLRDLDGKLRINHQWRLERVGIELSRKGFPNQENHDSSSRPGGGWRGWRMGRLFGFG